MHTNGLKYKVEFKTMLRYFK